MSAPETPPPADPALLAAANRALAAQVEDLRRGRDAARRQVVKQFSEVKRLAAWLYRIEGGDRPCDDAETLRRWAYEALTLGKEAP